MSQVASKEHDEITFADSNACLAVQDAKTDGSAEYNDIYKHINSFGSYQKKFAYGSCLILIGQSMIFGHMAFVTATPKFQCTTANVTCGINKCCTNCTSYEFDATFTTVISEWKLICGHSSVSALVQSMVFVGMMVGSFLSGILSDVFGRKKVIFISVGAMAACGLAQTFVQKSIPLFIFLRFGCGAFNISATLSHYILMMEIIGPEYRARMGNINNFYYTTGSFISILIGYLVRNWRTYSWITSVPPLLLYIFWCIFPESPRWLVVKGKLTQAHKIIMKYGGKDDKPCDPEQMMSLLKSIHENQVQRNATVKRYTPWDLVRTSKMRKWTLITGFGWFTTGLITFAISIYAAQLHGNVYIIFTIITALSALFILPAWLFMNILGRRVTHILFMAFAGLVLLMILPIPREYAIAVTILAVLGQVIIAQEWSSVYLISSELFPTVLRNTAQGVGSTASRIGGMVAPFVLLLAQLPGSSIVLPLTIFGGCAIVCALVSLWLPETAGRPLYQTTTEAEESPEDYGIPFLKKRRTIGQDTKLPQHEFETTKL